jgi:hypothetical protein
MKVIHWYKYKEKHVAKKNMEEKNLKSKENNLKQPKE